MAQITSSIGLISGINTGALTSELIAADAAPVSLLQTQVTSDQTLGTAYTALSSQLQTLQTTTQSLELPQTFQATTATSSNPSVLTATTTDGAAVGSYSLQVARTVTTQQLVSSGFTDATNAKVGAGTITIEEGSGSDLSTQTPLSDLNGGSGVARGQFRITDRSGASAVIDTSAAVSLDDVVADINSATNISVRASIQNNHLVLTDTSGQTASNLIVQDLGTGSSAASLGIVANTAGITVTGSDLNYLSSSTQLDQLNDGRGVTLGSGGATGDFTVHLKDGTSFNVNLAGVTTVGGAVAAINAASGGKATATIPTGSASLRLTDNTTTGSGTLSVTENNGSQAAADLGLTAASSGGVINGTTVLAGIDTTLLSSLNGGSGLTLGSVTITDRTGVAHTVNLSAATDVKGVINAINAGTGGAVTASLKSSGNGIQLTDDTSGSGSLTAANADGTDSATALGLAGTSTTGTLSGSDLDKQWLTDNTLLSSLNGGQGIGDGTFTITTAAGATATVTVGSTVNTVGQLLYQINSKGLTGLTASINATGNGIELTDASGGAGQLTVADQTGTAASDLNIAGKAATSTTTINGAYVKTITVGANDTLTSVAAAINAADAGVTASVISDGSTVAPYRLSLTSQNSGTAGAVVFDAGATGLATQTLVAAQDAAVFVGGSGGNGSSGSSATSAQPLLVTSSTNTISSVIPGVSLNLLGASATPVQLTIGADPSSLVTSLTAFTTTFNALTSSISSQSTYNTSSQSAGLLLGDPVAQDIQNNLFSMLNASVPGNGDYTNLYSVGFSVGDNDQLAFDANTFQAAFAADPTAVEALFNATTTTTNASNGATATTDTGLAYTMNQTLTKLADPISGSVTDAQTELTTEEQGFTDQITQLNALLAEKQTVYETEFANMESALATLQSISSSISGISGSTAATKAASSSSSSSS
jgi:flagellar hook-associated protein 2